MKSEKDHAFIVFNPPLISRWMIVQDVDKQSPIWDSPYFNILFFWGVSFWIIFGDVLTFIECNFTDVYFLGIEYSLVLLSGHYIWYFTV